MTDLPFALELSELYGRRLTIATFAQASDLWTFYDAWRTEADTETARAARFRHLGRLIRLDRPMADKAATLAWAVDCMERDKRVG